MQQVDIKALADKFSAGTCTEAELAILENWYLQWQPEDYDMDSTRLNDIMGSVWQAMPVKARPKKIRLWPKLAAAASIVIVIAAGLWLYTNEAFWPKKGPLNPIAYKNDIAPGKNMATLTLASGKMITLSGTKTGIVIGNDVKYNDGSLVQNGTTETLIATTPIGGTYTITLSDGTKVWLNADSKLEFPSKFGKKGQRMVRLSGEGYFEVARDHAHPFLVRTDKQEVTVLGTHFNINAYHDEEAVKTTLLEGSVSVSSFNRNHGSLPSRDHVILKPSQQSALSGSNRIAVSNVDANEAVAWKNGYFKFNQENIQSVMRKLSRWYGIDVAYESGLSQEKFTGRISRFKHISQVLKLMEAGKSVRFKVEGRRVTVIR